VLGKMTAYNDFTKEAGKMLKEMLGSKGYQKKRKAKMKMQIIRDGLAIPQDKSITSQKEIDTAQKPREKHITSSVNYPTIFLFGLFPNFEKDYSLLIKNEYMEKTQEGLHWKKTKQSLAEYFKDIKPQETGKISWKAIERVFGEKDLKNSASSNGNEFKGIAAAFAEWQKIKNGIANL
jgi:hypothetical protein